MKRFGFIKEDNRNRKLEMDYQNITRSSKVEIREVVYSKKVYFGKYRKRKNNSTVTSFEKHRL